MRWQKRWACLGLVGIIMAAGLWLTPPARAARLNCLILADSQNEVGGDSMQKDYDKIMALVEEVARNTGLELEGYGIKDEELTLAGVNGAIDDLICGADDVLLFYFAGHGARDQATKSILPVLAVNDGFLDSYDLLVKLAQKKPRLLLFWTDCCNNFVEEGVLRKGIRKPSRSENYRKLFVELGGIVIAAGAKPGDTSTGTDDGGRFTAALLEDLNTQFATVNPNWQNVKRDMIQTGSHVQHPLYLIKVWNPAAQEDTVNRGIFERGLK